MTEKTNSASTPPDQFRSQVFNGKDGGKIIVTAHQKGGSDGNSTELKIVYVKSDGTIKPTPAGEKVTTIVV